MGEVVRAAVLGASGYAGGELVRLLATHPSIEVVALGGHGSAGRTLAEVHPHLAGLAAADLPLDPIDGDPPAVDLAFTALPHGASARVVPGLLDAGIRVVDLGGDFRLPAEDYPTWYGFEHPAPERLHEAVYGLPELFGDRIGGAALVANPGCYPTPTVLGLAPLLAAGLIEPESVRVDGKTGLSGAGRGASEALSFSASEDSVRPYRAPGHQHTPEMERGLELATGRRVPILFVPHLVPAVRGVVTTAYARLAGGASTEDLTSCLRAAYEGRPFVRVLEAGAMVDAKRTRGSNVVELQAIADARTATAVVVGALDNLVKGAAGQAIQNANLALGLPEATGLPTAGVYP
ncbi:MAG: N-acetyl-gamma-glutamyl-phosphate reductase [Actinomycetota bacterium]|jgi:N-acetyl-gamma-glutamyl-phosphate reductase|nr:MAG: N-acetyl-gamma-glutamyl-phosphate reductase [Actinomycetota bacterium]